MIVAAASQAEGTIQSREDNRHTLRRLDNTSYKASPTDFASDAELRANDAGIYHMADGVTGPQFELALTRAKEQGNLSCANVVREIKGQNDPARLTRQQRADQIADLAEQGYSSRDERASMAADTLIGLRGR